QVDARFTNTKRNGGRVEQHEPWRAKVWVFREAEQIDVEGAGGIQIAHLQAHKIGSEKLCHEYSFLFCCCGVAWSIVQSHSIAHGSDTSMSASSTNRQVSIL